MACLMPGILSLKKNSLHLSMDRRSGASGGGGLFTLSTVANKECALLMFLVMMSEKKNCLALLNS